jgi:hypothetical protein
VAEINADVNDVLQVLSGKVADLSRENAVLLAQLSSAKKIIEDLEKRATPAAETVVVDSGKHK